VISRAVTPTITRLSGFPVQFFMAGKM